MGSPQRDIISTLTITLPDWINDKIEHGKRYLTAESRVGLAIALAEQNVIAKSGGPFGAAIFDQAGQVISVGVNRVVPLETSIAHAEMIAFALAQKRLGSHTVSGHGKFILASSSQMCAMCFGALHWSGISAVEFAASSDDAEKLVGFDEGPIHPRWQEELLQRGIEVKGSILREQACEVFKKYRAQSGAVYNG